jgi:hypothetical protein
MTDFKTFDVFESNNGVQYLKFFDNGYGVSIIKNDMSYGHELGLWELAVVKGDVDNYDLYFDTPIASDVVGFLNEEEVNDLVSQVQAYEETN